MIGGTFGLDFKWVCEFSSGDCFCKKKKRKSADEETGDPT